MAKEKEVSVLENYLTPGNIFLAIFTAFVVVLHTVYPRLLLLMYYSEPWGHIDHVFKVIANLVAHHDRSLLRNLVFNTIRCMTDDANGHVIFSSTPSCCDATLKVVGIWLLTWYFQKVVTRKFFLDHPKVYQCIMVFYVVAFGI